MTVVESKELRSKKKLSPSLCLSRAHPSLHRLFPLSSCSPHSLKDAIGRSTGAVRVLKCARGGFERERKSHRGRSRTSAVHVVHFKSSKVLSRRLRLCFLFFLSLTLRLHLSPPPYSLSPLQLTGKDRALDGLRCERK